MLGQELTASCILEKQCHGAQERHTVGFVDGFQPSSMKTIRDWRVYERGRMEGPVRDG